MNYDVCVDRLSSRQLAVVRRVAKPNELSRIVPEACGIVWSVIRSENIVGAGRHVAVYLDDQVNLEVSVELVSEFAGCGEVVRSSTPAGLAALTTHCGPYQSLDQAHDSIRHWCRQNGFSIAGPRWEVYGHWQNEWNDNPTKIRTDVFYLVQSTSHVVA